MRFVAPRAHSNVYVHGGPNSRSESYSELHVQMCNCARAPPKPRAIANCNRQVRKLMAYQLRRSLCVCVQCTSVPTAATTGCSTNDTRVCVCVSVCRAARYVLHIISQRPASACDACAVRAVCVRDCPLLCMCNRRKNDPYFHESAGDHNLPFIISTALRVRARRNLRTRVHRTGYDRHFNYIEVIQYIVIMLSIHYGLLCRCVADHSICVHAFSDDIGLINRLPIKYVACRPRARMIGLNSIYVNEHASARLRRSQMCRIDVTIMRQLVEHSRALTA